MSVDAYDRKATYREVLAAAGFTGLFAGRTVAIIGNTLQIFALSVLVYSSTGSPLLSALAFGAGFLPQVFGGVLLGSLADRVGPRSLILAGYALEALLAGLLGVFRMPVPAALLLVAAVACYMPVAYGASGRALAGLLGGDAYVLGRSLFTIASSAAQLVGLAFGGVLLAAMGARGALLASAAFGVLAVLVTVLTMPKMPAARGDDRTGTMRAGLAGSMEVFADATVRRLFLVQWLPPAMCAGAESLLVAYAGTRHFPAATVSALMAAIPVGMVAGNFVLGRAAPGRRLRAVPWLLAVLGLPFAFLPVRLPLLAAVALLVVAGVGTAYAIGLQRPFLDAVPEDRSGQAFALLSAGLMTVQGLAPVALGGIAEVTAPGTAIAVAGVAVLLLIPVARPRKFLPRPGPVRASALTSRTPGSSLSKASDKDGGMGGRLLEADCASCAGLCCVAPAFAKSSDFAVDKPAGTACRNLGDDFRCRIHERLSESGFHGCVVFDCFGAGQRLTQETFGGADWRSDTTIAGPMFASLPIMRQLHELMWYVTEALKLDEARGVHGELREVLAETDRLGSATPAELKRLDLDAYRGKVNPLLQRASELARAHAGGKRRDYRGADLVGRLMRGQDLRGASFRGALLIGADLRDSDLRRADFTGADLRGTDLRGADLTGVLFLTAAQRRAAITDISHP